MVRHAGFEQKAQRFPKSLKTAHSPMFKALIWCEGPALSSSFAVSSPQITTLSWNSSPDWQGQLSCPFCCFPSLKFLMKLLLLLMFMLSTFSCTYFFFYRDCKLLRVQHCTCLPFVNDLDLLKTKILLESSMNQLPYPQLWQMVLKLG